jgi:hypothetical protein
MEDGSPLPAASESAPPPPSSPEAPRDEAPVDAPAAADDTAAVAPTPAQAQPDDDALAAGNELTRGIAQRDRSLDLDSIILIDPDTAPADDPGPLPQIYPAASTYPAPSAAPSASWPPAAAIPPASPPPADAPAQPAMAASPEATAAKRTRGWIWTAASVLLLATLLAQTAFFLRDTVVSRLPQTRPAFERICAAFGCTLSLPKNLALLQIVGSDLQTEASGRLKFTLTLGNRAAHAQAWPVLVLTLTDQRNRPLTRRSFAPSEYLGDANRIAAGIAPRSEEALSLPLTVRGPAPMGFDLRLTY